jgi:hypothetical protein
VPGPADTAMATVAALKGNPDTACRLARAGLDVLLAQPEADASPTSGPVPEGRTGA